MTINWPTLLATLAAQATLLGLGAWYIRHLIERMMQENDALRSELKAANRDALTEIKHRVDALERGETMSARLEERIKTLLNRLASTEHKLDLNTDTTARTAASLDALKGWVDNLNGDFQSHQRDRYIHGGPHSNG
jgi:chromosome segregation ATPase